MSEKLCDNCDNCDKIHPREKHPHTDRHYCLKYGTRIFHGKHHPNLVRVSGCTEGEHDEL